jgi:NAD(P)-dependent dehydrogenase (short-subunit alcohol dehydrogenase family)
LRPFPWALEAFSDTLSQEVAQYGIKVTLIEPGSMTPTGEARQARRKRTASMTQAGPAATTAPILEIVDTKKPPLRLLLGAMPVEVPRTVYEDRLRTWAEVSPIRSRSMGILA